MIPFLPGSRRRAADTDGHVRARTLLAERLDAEIADSDAAWLSNHLITCADCASVEAEYVEQRSLLRGLAEPVPPRDLWARTSAKIELEPGGSGARSPRRSVVPLGALSGALVVAVVVGASLLSQPTVQPSPSDSPKPLPSVAAAASVEPSATPIAVAAGEVGWALQNDDGSYDLAFADVEEVCGSDIEPDCAPLDPPSTRTLQLTAVPRAIVKSPTQDELVVVEAGTRSGGGSVIVMPVPTPKASPEPTIVPSPSVEPSPSPSPTPTPSAGASPSIAPTVEPSPSPTSAPSIAPSPSPSGGDTTGGVDSIAIAFDVVVVGETAGYSSDGAWFAFSARPADGTAGPDIYVWQPGEESARAVTTDHRSVFSAWVGGRILGSRVIQPLNDAPAGASPLPATTVSFLLDPATDEETLLYGARIWRPVVDPTRRFVVFWDGDVEVAPNGVDWRPASGRLVLARWDPAPVPAATPSGAGQPSVSPEPASSASPVPSATGQTPSTSPVAVLATLSDDAVLDWDIHWDETGTRFAIWFADPVDPDVGSIDLHEIDRETAVLDPNGAVLVDAPALAGFSIGDGRLVWATPPGQGGEGSRIVVLAWSGDESGRIESAPDKGSAPVVVIK